MRDKMTAGDRYLQAIGDLKRSQARCAQAQEERDAMAEKLRSQDGVIRNLRATVDILNADTGRCESLRRRVQELQEKLNSVPDASPLRYKIKQLEQERDEARSRAETAGRRIAELEQKLKVQTAKAVDSARALVARNKLLEKAERQIARERQANKVEGFNA